MNTRKAVLDDRNKIFALLKKEPLFTQEEIACALELLDIYLTQPAQKDYDFIVSVDEQDNVLGYICYGKVPLTDAVYDLYWIVVDRTTQNRGVGKVLLSRLDEILLEKGARMLLAETSSKTSYAQTRSFYVKRGFVEISRIPDFYAENDGKIVFAKFYSLFERRRSSQWRTRIASPVEFGLRYRTNNGMIGTGRSETASGR